jgi:subtilisin family serine protease
MPNDLVQSYLSSRNPSPQNPLHNEDKTLLNWFETGLTDVGSERFLSNFQGSSSSLDTVGVAGGINSLDTAAAVDLNNVPSSAIDLGVLRGITIQNDSVGSSDPSDFYRFTLSKFGSFNLALAGLNADADVKVFRDINNNGTIDIGEEVGRSVQSGSSDEWMNLENLMAGTYFVQVYQFSGSTPYSLRLSNSDISEFLTGGVTLGTLNSTQTVSGSFSSKDTTNLYRFTLGAAAPLNLSLTGLSADADVRLIRDINQNGMVEAGEEVARSQQGYGLDEFINLRSLAAGTYFVQAYQFNGETNYTLNLSTTNPSNLLPTEVNLGILNATQTVLGAIYNTDTVDVYRFDLSTTKSLTLNLSDLSTDVDLRLIVDANHNGIIDSGDVIADSVQGGSLPETLTQVLSAGTYFVQVYQYSGETNYALSLSTTTISVPVDNAGNTLATARNIGNLSSLQTFNDYVGTLDTNDFYRFTLNQTNNLTLNLSGLSADADMQLIQDVNGNGAIESGEILAYPWQGGTQPENLTTALTAGTYYIRVFPYSSSTPYILSASVTPIISPSRYDLNYGYGLVNAATAVAQAAGQNPYANVPNLGGNRWNLDRVNAPEVWAQGFTGQGVVVAVVDSGVDYTHSDLNANIWVNSDEVAGNGIDDDSNGYIDDVRGWDFTSNDNTPLDSYGHGTHVAGTIAAENNGVGSIGVAYNARIMPVRVLDSSGSGTWSDVAAGIRYSANNGARVINLSLGGDYSSEVASAVQYAAERGAIVVMASGNESRSNPGFPANLATQWGIAVGAVNISNQLANFSNDAGLPVVNYVVAPGVGVYSTLPNNRYQSYNGTSMAAPHVAGVAALMLSANPNLTAAQVINLLLSTATRTGITV